ncbi:MAG: type I restriction enzyme HsdR N-terminal domain-containing protein [Bacteroidetes bacterium]|nr:MAG: type I restriction enzyme HsdR N-terminal domain-containing protein [Bacteroidota bacterium]
MQKLNLPEYGFRVKVNPAGRFVLDIFRRKYVLFTPEEEVRQRFAWFLAREMGYPASLMMTEQSLKLNEMTWRCDILVHKPAGFPAVLVECKAPGVRITRETFDQVARYNLVFRVRYLMVTNGLSHYCCRVDFGLQKVVFLEEIPSYDSLE